MKKFVNLLTVAICALLLISASTSNNTAFAESKTVRLGGQPFGVRFYNDGLIVVELEEFYDGEKYVCPAKDGGLKENDIIKEVNKTPVNTNEELQNAAEGARKYKGKTVKPEKPKKKSVSKFSTLMDQN